MREYDLQLRYTHFPLHPDTPLEGQTLEDLFANRLGALEAMRTRLPQLMAGEGLDYGDRSMTYNSRLAQELAKWAETQPKPIDIHKALFRAYFVKDLNLGDPVVLIGIAVSAGLPEEEARNVVLERRFKDAVDRDWKRSRELGVSGVPTYVVGDRGLVGAQPYEALEALVAGAGATRSSTSRVTPRLG